MDKFLMSLPTQLSQPFDLGSDSALLHLNNMDLYESQVPEDLSFSNFYANESPLAELLDELVPVLENDPSSRPPAHLKNFSIDTQSFANLSFRNGPENAAFLQQNGHHNGPQTGPDTTTAIAALSGPHTAPAGSFSAFHAGDQGPQQLQNPSLQAPAVATPRRPGRNKLALVLSVNVLANVYSTPLRLAAAQLPVNVVLMPNKVGKTPHSTKPKGHSRSRSRLLIDGNTPIVWGTASKLLSFQNLAYQTGSQGLNPFYTPLSYISPRVDGSAENDELATPQPTPASGHLRTLSHTYFSPQNPPFPLKRNDTLESINIEDQDDDAFKQLRKAKLYASIPGKQREADFATDILLKMATQLEDHPSSQLTPGLLYQSPSRLYSTLSQGYAQPGYDFEAQNPFDMYKQPQPRPVTVPNFYRSASSIDLLLPQLVHTKQEKNRPFTKSHPAALDLASIAAYQSQNNQSHSQNSQNNHNHNHSQNSQNQLQQNLQYSMGLLPPMATFPVAQDLLFSQSSLGDPSIVDVAERILPSDLKLPIKLADKPDVVDPKKKHQCPLCQARFQRPEHVKRHLKSHSSEKPYQCDEADCGKRFNRKDNLKAHLKKIHQRPV